MLQSATHNLDVLLSRETTHYSPEELLQAHWHLACIEGVDVGSVIPLLGFAGTLTFGRTHPLVTDPQVSRAHLSVNWKGHKLHLHECASTNGSSLTRKKRRFLITQTPFSCELGDHIHCGASTWEIRERPRSFSLPHQKKEQKKTPLSSRSFLGVLSLIFLPLSLLRLSLTLPWWILALLVALIFLGLAIVLWLRKRHSSEALSFDASSLLLHLAHCRTRPSTPEDNAARDSSPWPNPLHVDLWEETSSHPRTPGFFGTHALLHAIWTIATHARQFNGCTVLTGDGAFSCGSGEKIVHLVHGSECLICAGTPQKGIGHVAVSPSSMSLPAWCDYLVEAHEPAPISISWVLQAFRPEDSAVTDEGLPSLVVLKDLWEEVPLLPAESAYGHLFAPLGYGENALPMSIDLVDDGPHSVLVGTTGSGKSEALITLLLGLARQYAPERLRFILIDYKGGTSLGVLSDLPHTECLLSDIHPTHTHRAFLGIRALFWQREKALAASPYVSVSDWEREDPANAPHRVVIAFDEFTTFADYHPDLFQDTLRLTAQGRALGIHVIFASQRPDQALSPALLANTGLRIALRCRDGAASRALLGTEAAAFLPQIPGRAIVEGRGEIQCAWAQSPAEIVSHLRATWSGYNLTPLWLSSLPSCLHRVQIEGLAEDDCVVGLVDGILEGAHIPVVWRGGHIRFEGSQSQRMELFSGAFNTAHAIARHQRIPLLTCNSPTPGTDTNLPLHDAAALVHYLAHADSVGSHIFLIHDMSAFDAALGTAIGHVHATHLWRDFLDRAQNAHISIVATRIGANSLWDAHAQPFSLRFLRSLCTSEATVYGLNKTDFTDATPGRFLLTSAPPGTLISSRQLALPQHAEVMCSPSCKAAEEAQRNLLPTPLLFPTQTEWMEKVSPDCLVISKDKPSSLPRELQGLQQIHPKNWMEVLTHDPSELIVCSLTDELRRILLPFSSDSDWILRIKRIPDGYGIWIFSHQAHLIRLNE